MQGKKKKKKEGIILAVDVDKVYGSEVEMASELLDKVKKDINLENKYFVADVLYRKSNEILEKKNIN